MNGKGGIISPGFAITGILGGICAKPDSTEVPPCFADGDMLGGGCEVSMAGVTGDPDTVSTGGGTAITPLIVAANTGGTGGAGMPSGKGM